LELEKVNHLQQQLDDFNKKCDAMDLPFKRLLEYQDSWKFVREVTLDE
jgi:hypothetical protein